MLASSDKGIQKQIQQAYQTGKLNLSCKGLKQIPQSVLQPQIEAPQASLSKTNTVNWWQVVDITRLVLSDNIIADISGIEALPALVHLDLRNNKIKFLPETFGTLSCLSFLNLSGNELSQLPASLFNINLSNLDLSKNQISVIPPEISKLSNSITCLNLSGNKIEACGNISALKRLQNLDLSFNNLQFLGYSQDFAGFASLNTLNLSYNSLILMFLNENASCEFASLQTLDLKYNKLRSFCQFITAPKLKQLSLGCNQIINVSDILLSAPELAILDLKDNKLTEVPKSILKLNSLKRLDISNNDIKSLIPELGLIVSIDVLVYSGNPLRGVPSGSTDKVLKWLRDKIEIKNDGEFERQQFASRVLDLSAKNLTGIDSGLISNLNFEPIEVNVNRNRLVEFPHCLQVFGSTLSTIRLAKNLIAEFPSITLPNLKLLDLSGNSLAEIPNISQFPQLKELNLSNNRITGPFPQFHLNQLSILIASGNNISEINVSNLGVIQVLDLANNSISQLPNQLGLIPTLTTLVLEGNLFRVPRRAILERGTEAIKAYLADRIGQ